MLISALLMTAALMGTDPDGVMVTAPKTPVALDAAAQPETISPEAEAQAQARTAHGLTTNEQIDRWIAARDPNGTPYADAGRGLDEAMDDRKPHSMVDVSFGTGGYRSYGAAVSLPLGDSGRLDIAVRQTENGYGYGYGGGRYGYYSPDYDYSGYAFPGYRPNAAQAFEYRVARPDGPPRRFGPAAQPQQPASE